MPGREFAQTNSNYRYGFNGKEKDNKDGVVQYDYGFRIYDPRLVRFKSVDPLSGSYPYFTPYQFASNNPIANIDLDGLEGRCVITDQFKIAFVKGHDIMNDDKVKYAMSQGQTVVMKLTYAAGPDDKDTKDIVLNDGGMGADVMNFDAQTNGINAEWGHYFINQPPALVKISGAVEPIAIDLNIKQPSGIIPRKIPDDFIKKAPNDDGKVTGKKSTPSPPKIDILFKGHHIKENEKVELPVYFQGRSDQTTSDEYIIDGRLKGIADQVKNTNIKITLSGYVLLGAADNLNTRVSGGDFDGKSFYELAKARTEMVKASLIRNGVKANQIQTVVPSSGHTEQKTNIQFTQ